MDLIRKYTLAFCTVLLAAALSGSSGGTGSDSRDLFLPLDCPPTSSFDVNESLPVPVADDLSPYTDNLDGIVINWNDISDENVGRFWVVLSEQEDFDPVKVCDLLQPHRTSDTIIYEKEGPVYCRVYTVDQSGDSICSEPNTIQTIQDITPPELTSLELSDSPSASGNGWTADPEVYINYTGIDSISGCALVEIANDSTFSRVVASDSITSGVECSGSIDFRLSAGFERKTIYARVYDRAGHISDVYSASIVYEKGAHCYPNPFDPSGGEVTNFVFQLSGPGNVSIHIYDKFGNFVNKLSRTAVEGLNEVPWDGRNSEGEIVANGGYIGVIKGDREYNCKVAVLK